MANIGVRTPTDHQKWSWVENEKVALHNARQLLDKKTQIG